MCIIIIIHECVGKQTVSPRNKSKSTTIIIYDNILFYQRVVCDNNNNIVIILPQREITRVSALHISPNTVRRVYYYNTC